MTDNPSAWYLVATDDGNDAAYTAAREAGFALATDAGAGVILYDRTSESKMTNPYPAGPWSDESDALSPEHELEPETLREMGRAYLAEQVEQGRSRGLQVRAHLAVNTGAEALSDAVERYRPATVVFPEKVSNDGGLLDKVRHNTVADLLAGTDAQVVLVDAQGNPVG
jgi:hypothetical protein